MKLASVAKRAWDAGLQLEAVKYINLALALDADRENWKDGKPSGNVNSSKKLVTQAAIFPAYF